MTTVDTDRRERGIRAFEDVMTFPAPQDSTPATTNMLDFVFAEVWQRPMLSRRARRFITLPCVAAADAPFRGVRRLAEGVAVHHGGG